MNAPAEASFKTFRIKTSHNDKKERKRIYLSRKDIYTATKTKVSLINSQGIMLATTNLERTGNEALGPTKRQPY